MKYLSFSLGYSSYVGLLATEHHHNHPCLRVFCQIMNKTKSEKMGSTTFTEVTMFENRVVEVEPTEDMNGKTTVIRILLEDTAEVAMI